MRGKDRNILIIVIGLVVVLVVIILFFLPGSKQEHFSWSETYYQKSDQPYGTEVLSKLLESYFDDHDFVVVRNNLEELLQDSSGVHKSYVFIGWEPYLTDSIFMLLTDFVHAGNDAFFAVKEIPAKLSNSIFMTGTLEHAMDSAFYTTEYGDTIWYEKPLYQFDSTTFSYFTAENMSMNFVAPGFKRDSSWQFQFYDKDEKLMYDWRYFVPNYINRLYAFDSLGSVHSENFLNYIRIPYGKGYFYLHTNPLVFTNYFQIQERNIEYTSKVFSYLKPGDIIWDEASKTYGYDDSGFNFGNEQAGPLKYILSQEPLRWAWYVILSGLLLFLLFRTKRTQKAIPVTEPNENKSLEFIQTIGRMYFISKNHKLIAQQKMKLFLHFINNRYRITTQEFNDEFYLKLQLKSEITQSEIKTIFGHFRYLDNTTEVTQDDLIYFHQLLDSFYKTCK